MTSQYPLRHQSPEAIIWQLASGRQQSVTHLKCTAGLKVGLRIDNTVMGGGWWRSTPRG